MNLAALGAVSPGYTQGQNAQLDLKAKAIKLQQDQMALDESKRQLEALAASVAQQSAPQPPAPGQSSVPNGPQQQPQPPMPAPRPPGPMDIRPPPQGPQPPAPAPGPAPQPAGPAPLPASSQNADPANAPSDFYKQSAQIMQSVIKGIKDANPGIDNLTLAEAAQKQIEMLKSIDPETKAALTLQTQLLKAQLQYTIGLQKVGTAQEAMELTHDYHKSMASVAEARIAETQRHNKKTEDQRDSGEFNGGSGGSGAGGSKEADRISREKIALQRRKETALSTYQKALTLNSTTSDKATARQNYQGDIADIADEAAALKKREEALGVKQTKQGVELPEGGKVASQKKLPPKIGTTKADAKGIKWTYRNGPKGTGWYSE